MSLTKNRWFRRLGFGAVAALSIGAATMSAGPAQAHDYGHRAPVARAIHSVSHFPRFFFGGGHYWHRDYHHWR